MYKGLFSVRFVVEDRSEELLYLSNDYDRAKSFYDRKVEELKKDSGLDYCCEDKHYYCGDFIRTTIFVDNELISHEVLFANDMWFHDNMLYHPTGEFEEMTEEELKKTLDNYYQSK